MEHNLNLEELAAVQSVNLKSLALDFGLGDKSADELAEDVQRHNPGRGSDVLRQENDKLRREIDSLKDEVARLRGRLPKTLTKEVI